MKLWLWFIIFAGGFKMTIIHKIEFWIGIATPVCAFLAPLYLFCMAVGDLGPYALVPFVSGLIPFVLSIPLAVSAKFHSKHGTSLSLFAVISSAVVFCAIHAFLSIFAFVWSGPAFTFLFVMPVVFAIATAILAIVAQLAADDGKF